MHSSHTSGTKYPRGKLETVKDNQSRHFSVMMTLVQSTSLQKQTDFACPWAVIWETERQECFSLGERCGDVPSRI